ncbi:MAG: hypothetical protein CM15mP62_23860 [Rhodospirillaceae bacterium]|nr:MAG: hypothetical protein CM15mP62_23860 [Rhodospirillaceae bacterium]
MHPSVGKRFWIFQLWKNEFINIEYVSANPTGPLHAAHARGAVVGDTSGSAPKSRVRVCKEYYVNDAGTK